MSNPRVIAVVVAWNRAALLRETLDGLAAQTRPLDGVVVVDNASVMRLRNSLPLTPLFPTSLLCRKTTVVRVVSLPELPEQ